MIQAAQPLCGVKMQTHLALSIHLLPPSGLPWVRQSKRGVVGEFSGFSHTERQDARPGMCSVRESQKEVN